MKFLKPTCILALSTLKEDPRRTIFSRWSFSDNSRVNTLDNRVRNLGEGQLSIFAPGPKLHLLATRPWENTNLWFPNLGALIKDRNSKASFSMRSTKAKSRVQTRKRTKGQPNLLKPIMVLRGDVSRKINRKECSYHKWERKKRQSTSLIFLSRHNLTRSICPSMVVPWTWIIGIASWNQALEIQILMLEQPQCAKR